MPTLKQCKDILEENGETYTDEQVEQIRSFLFHWAKLNVEQYLNSLRNEKCSNNGKGELGRTSSGI